MEKIAEDVVKLFKNQQQQMGDVVLRSIKVSLPPECDADEVAKYIIANYPMYKAHSKGKEKGHPILAIGHP